MRMRKKKGWALLLAAALLTGILPVGNASVSRAEETSAQACKYGLKNPVVKTVSPPENTSHGLSNPRNEDGTVTWDCVYFGNYWQNDTNGDGVADKNDEKEPIKWRVLSVDGDDAFLLADTNLDVQIYHGVYEDVTWETCTMRSWLNGYGADVNLCGIDYSGNNFLDNAFTGPEQVAIKDIDVINEDNPEYGTEGGIDTIDKVYLLSLSEVMNPSYGFFAMSGSSATREAVNTAYVTAGGGFLGDYVYVNSTYWWWLRSPGSNSQYASYVESDGHVVYYGINFFDDGDIAVRPALHLNISDTSVWSYADTVISTGKRDEIVVSNPPVTISSSAGQNPAAVTSPAPAQNTPVAGQEEVQKTDEKTTPAKVTGLKLKAKKKAIEASWKKGSGATGYEIQVSTLKKFTKKSIKTTKKTKLTVSKLKPKTKYFVRVRAYSVTNGKKTYGKWSKITNIKTKK